MKKYSLEKFKENKKNKKMIKSTVVVIIATIILIFVSLYLAHSGFRSFVDTYIFRKKILEENANSITIDTEGLSLIYAYDKSLVIYADGNVNFYNSEAKKTGNVEITLSKPIADSEDKYLALGDYGSQKVCLIKSNNLVWQKDVEGKVSKISVNKQGYVALSITGTTYESIVMLYKPSGDLLFSAYLSDYVMDIDISEDSKYLAIAEIDNSSIIPATKIEMVSVEKAISNAEEATINTYQAENSDLLTGMKFQGKNKLLCSFDKYVLKMTDKSNDKIYEISELTAYVDVDLKNGFMRVDKEKSSVFKSDYRLKINNTKGSEKIYIIEGSIKEISSKDKMIALNLGEQAIFVKDNGWLSKRYVSRQEIKKVLVTQKIGVIIYKNKISVITL